MRVMKGLVILGLLAVTGQQAVAETQYNTRPFLGPQRAMIQSAIAKSYSLRGRDLAPTVDGVPRCDVETDGVIRQRRPDGQSLVVVTRPVINNGGTVEIGRDCR